MMIRRQYQIFSGSDRTKKREPVNISQYYNTVFCTMHAPSDQNAIERVPKWNCFSKFWAGVSHKLKVNITIMPFI